MTPEYNIGDLIWCKNQVWVVDKIGKAQLSCIAEGSEEKASFTIYRLDMVGDYRDQWSFAPSGVAVSREEADARVANYKHKTELSREASELRRLLEEAVNISFYDGFRELGSWHKIPLDGRKQISEAIKTTHRLLIK